jgi:hypothetical protein
MWYAIVSFGSSPAPAKGPFASVEKAEDAVSRFRSRHGSLAGTYLAAGSTRIVGPFASRAAAREADISDAPVIQQVG